jgi:hypothetical protein
MNRFKQMPKLVNIISIWLGMIDVKTGAKKKAGVTLLSDVERIDRDTRI